jgi:hypothetical protein
MFLEHPVEVPSEDDAVTAQTTDDDQLALGECQPRVNGDSQPVTFYPRLLGADVWGR